MPLWSKKRRILLSKTSNNCADGEVYWWGVVNFNSVQMSLVLSVRFISVKTDREQRKLFLQLTI